MSGVRLTTQPLSFIGAQFKIDRARKPTKIKDLPDLEHCLSLSRLTAYPRILILLHHARVNFLQ